MAAYALRAMRILSNPFVKVGIPTVGGVVLGTLFLQELVKINQILPNRATGIKEEELVDTFDINKELEKLQKTVDLEEWVNKRVPRPGEKP